MTVSIDPMRIEITPREPEGVGYKSIRDLVWDAIPGFAILTGRNGSGKTQLLEILAHHFAGTFPPTAPGDQFPVTVRVVGAEIADDQVGFVPSSGRFSGGGVASIGQMANYRNNFLQQADQVHSYRHDLVQSVKAKHMRRLLKGRPFSQLRPDEVEQVFPDDFSPLLVDLDVVGNLATIFVAHRLKLLESLERGTAGKDKEGQDIGPAPWDVVNDSLRVAGFPYEVITPLKTPILDNYFLRLRNTSSGLTISPTDLSSGEQVLLQLTLWLFAAGKEGTFPKLLLLDEPDAYLHPSMTVQFLDVVLEVLVRKYGVRVMMTTHSPSTVALAPEGSVFQLERGAAAIKPVLERAAMVATLTSGLITVSAATKYCFVEDDGDVGFYQAVQDVLTDYGPSRDPQALAPSPSLVFIAASIGKGTQRVAGGSSIVAKWVDKLDVEPLVRTFLGVVDRDAGNVETSRVKVLGRYSFENYLLDPPIVFGLLLDNGTAPHIDGLTVNSGDEHLLRIQSADMLQAISNAITNAVERVEPGLACPDGTLVTYTRGQKITVPRWLIDHRGHDLLPAFQRAWGGHQVVTPPRLLRALRRVRLIPTELAGVFASLQTS